MAFLIESIVLCAIFTLIVVINSKNPLKGVEDFPPAVVEWAKTQNLISTEKKKKSKSFIVRKIVGAILCTLILTAVVTFINGAENYSDGFLISYALWLVVDWYDCFVIDWILCTYIRSWRIKGSEDMPELYKDNRFHAKKSFIGMFIGLPIAALVGAITVLFNMMR